MKTITAIALSASALTLAAGAAADPIDGIYVDVPGCDDHGSRFAAEEIGRRPVFGLDDAVDTMTTIPIDDVAACAATNDPGIDNVVVLMTNLTGRALDNLWYVGDVGTSFTNADGVAEGAGSPGQPGLAFRIDDVGVNRPLLLETMTSDGIFEPGETWSFIVQDYQSPLGLPADSFLSIGLAGDSSAIVQSSSASIVRMVPTPGSASLIALGGLAAARRRR